MASDAPATRRDAASWVWLLPVVLLFLFALNQAVRENNFQDFFIYRVGAVVGLRGESPYEPAKLRDEIARQFPGDPLADNAGYFGPPGSFIFYGPFALLPYPAAKVAWAAVNALAMCAVVLLLPRLFASPPGSVPRPRPLVELLVSVAMCLNFVTVAIVVVGQTTLVVVGCVALGQWFFERGRPTLGCLLWAFAFIKPHVALPLIPLAWYLGGWRRAAGLVLALALFTLVGCLIVGRSPLFVREYIEYLGASHKAVRFNQVAENNQLTSWNRIVFSFTGRAIELDATKTVAGYLVWYGLILARCAVSRAWPSPAWAAAASAAGALVCCQALGYEVFWLALAIPYIRDLVYAGRVVPAILILAFMAAQMVPTNFESIGMTAPRAMAVAGVAVVVLAGPLFPQKPARS